jgi:hypothetical protein
VRAAAYEVLRPSHRSSNRVEQIIDQEPPRSRIQSQASIEERHDQGLAMRRLEGHEAEIFASRPVLVLGDRQLSGTQKNRNLPSTNLGCQLAGTAFQGTTLLCLREMHDLRSTIAHVIALGE